MKKIDLHIDATREKPLISLLNDLGERIAFSEVGAQNFLSEKILQTIDELLKERNFTLADLQQIVVNPGPGSYTSLRIALTTANCLAFSLDIPVLTASDQKGGKFSGSVLPIYYAPPVITRRKSRL